MVNFEEARAKLANTRLNRLKDGEKIRLEQH